MDRTPDSIWSGARFQNGQRPRSYRMAHRRLMFYGTIRCSERRRSMRKKQNRSRRICRRFRKIPTEGSDQGAASLSAKIFFLTPRRPALSFIPCFPVKGACARNSAFAANGVIYLLLPSIHLSLDARKLRSYTPSRQNIAVFTVTGRVPGRRHGRKPCLS